MNPDAVEKEYTTLRVGLIDHFLSGGRLAVVKAPPGSGKTHTLVEVLAALTDQKMRVAVAAQTNNQADDICARLVTAHPAIPVVRFGSGGSSGSDELPSSVVHVTDKKELPNRAGVTVSTTAKWALTDLPSAYDLLAVDEAWQMSWADLMQCATVSGRFLMIGDPGQIPPVVTIDTRRWETSPRAPHIAAPEVVMTEPGLENDGFVGSLPTCRRLPNESVDFIRPFYDFDFSAYVAPGTRGLELTGDWGNPLAAGRPLALTIPTPEYGPPIEVDHDIACTAAEVVRRLLSEATLRLNDGRRSLTLQDIGVTSSHRVMNAALTTALGSLAGPVRVDTPERWQGLERPVMIAVHPLSGVIDPSAFDLETGRLCVMASRHQAGLILLTRDHVGDTLRNFVPSAGQAPGRPDSVGRGHHAHLTFWSHLEETAGIVPL